MLLKRKILSIFFILSYLTGFSHDLIPHHHGIGGHSHAPHNHGNEQCDHDHVSHNDHFDENIFDLFFCVLIEFNSNNNSKEINHATIQPSQLNKLNVKGKIKYILLQKTVLNIIENTVLKTEFQTRKELSYSPPLTLPTPLRGPPALMFI